MEREPTYLSREEKFTNQINDKFDFWISIIDDSKVDQETKDEIRKRLSNFKENAFSKWNNLDDAFYGAISSMSTIMKRDKNTDEATALFENIRDDIWQFFSEIKS